jgi:colanic acid biosynthesis protein WcaH
MCEYRIPESEWQTIVEHVPIVSVDLVVYRGESVFLAKRTNEPAKGEWFVPGGRVKKGETRKEAVRRVAQTELGVDVTIVEELGAYEHFYDKTAANVSSGKHYLANGYVVEVFEEPALKDDQHKAAEWIPVDELRGLHEHVGAYLADADSVPFEL